MKMSDNKETKKETTPVSIGSSFSFEKNLITNLTAEVAYDQDGEFEDEPILFELKYLSKKDAQSLGKSATKVKTWNKVKSEESDEDVFNKNLAKKCIVGWKNLTFEKLAMILPIEVPEGTDPKTQIPFDMTNAVALLKHGYGFGTWLQDIVTEIAVFRKGDKATEQGN